MCRKDFLSIIIHYMLSVSALQIFLHVLTLQQTTEKTTTRSPQSLIQWINSSSTIVDCGRLQQAVL